MTDLSGIDPMRWKEVRRRIDIVKGFVAIARPTPGQRIEFSNRLGLSRSTFDRIVKAWKRTGNAVVMKGHGPDRFRRWSATRSDASRDAVVALVKDVVDRLGTETAGATVTREVEDLCSRAGLPVPPVSTTWHMIQAARRASAVDLRARRELVIGRCLLKLPMDTDAGIRFPIVTLAITSPERMVLGFAVRTDDDENTAEAELLERLAAEGLVDRQVVASTRADARVREVVDRHAVTMRDETPARTAHLVGRLVTNRLGLIAVVVRRSRVIPAERAVLNSVQDYFDPADLETAVGYAVERHNAERRARAT